MEKTAPEKKPEVKSAQKVGNILEDYENLGWDTDMCPYKSIDDMWKTELGTVNIANVKNPTKSKD